MPFQFTVPRVSGNLDITVDAGGILFVLGANGTGKSALMQRLYMAHGADVRRISAHRQTWFSSSALSMSPADRRNTGQNIFGQDQTPQARWREWNPEARATIAIYDLIEAENARARSIAGAVDSDNIELAKTLARKDAPIKVINELMRTSNLQITISVRENEEVVASKSGSPPFSIAELSDGERNALLIAANVLTVKRRTLILIDEPERHLHRSIISPLLTQLFAQRSDCAFVVSTHDIMLPLDNPSARTLLVRGCTFSGNAVSSWDADLVPAETEVDADIKKDILGARRKVLFVEGTEDSLDKPIYSLIFPEVSVVPKASCRDVEHAVSGIRDFAHLHWVHAFGIVDNDARGASEIAALQTKGIFALPVFSVESLYYHPEVQQRVAARHAAVTGDSAEGRVADAKTAALEAIGPHVRRLSERAVEKSVREAIFRQLPRRAGISAGSPINISVNVARELRVEEERLQRAIAANDLVALLRRYPVRETPALGAIANRLGFQGRQQYESAVRKLLMDDAGALAFVKSLFGSLHTEICA